MKLKSLSGIQPSGKLHIGNYFGAIKQFIDLQDKYEGYYFIADYHALTSNPMPSNLRESTIDAVISFLALGLDPNKSTIFMQSDIKHHLELSWILSNVTPMSLLERGHAYKDKVAKGIKPNVGLFSYPILMAADILLYDVDLVPVGKDQTQHIEFTRDIATKFNEHYKTNYLKLPSGLILDDSSLIVGTDGNKMSKSYKNTIDIFADEKTLKKQVMSIVTDSANLEDVKNPDNNIMSIYKMFASNREIEELKDKFLSGNFGYGTAKKILLDKILEYFQDARTKRTKLLENSDIVNDLLNESKNKMLKIVTKRMDEIKDIVGLYKY